MSWDEVYYGLWHQQGKTSDLLNRRLGVWHRGRASKMLYSVFEETSALSRRLAQDRAGSIELASLGGHKTVGGQGWFLTSLFPAIRQCIVPLTEPPTTV
ncbi:MAG: hypothetical protein F4Y37_14545 [Caldilineaceae bacterium SB0664_bin_22]|nr:hypothetical protein [Caldilineaceae bacterium SB0664_bin_22]